MRESSRPTHLSVVLLGQGLDLAVRNDIHVVSVLVEVALVEERVAGLAALGDHNQREELYDLGRKLCAAEEREVREDVRYVDAPARKELLQARRVLKQELLGAERGEADDLAERRLHYRRGRAERAAAARPYLLVRVAFDGMKEQEQQRDMGGGIAGYSHKTKNNNANKVHRKR